MTPESDATQTYEPMAVVEKYESVIRYLYPIAQSLPRKHGVARDMFLGCLLGQVQLFVEAGNQARFPACTSRMRACRICDFGCGFCAANKCACINSLPAGVATLPTPTPVIYSTT